MQTLISGKQCRAARAMLGWTIDDLAENSSLARSVILRLEKEETNIRQTSLNALLKTFSRANIDFIGRHGVSEKRDSVELLKGDNAFEQLWENITFTLEDTGGELLIHNTDEHLPSQEHGLKQHNITGRVISVEGNANFTLPKKCYRWLPKTMLVPNKSTYLYDGKVAYQLWDKQMITLVHSNDAFTSEKKRFEHLWETALVPNQQN